MTTKTKAKTKAKSIYDLGVKIKVSEVKGSIKGYEKMTSYERAKALDALSVDRTLKKLYWGCKAKAVRDNKVFKITFKDLQNAWKKQHGKCAVSKIDMQLNSGTRQEPNLYRVSVDRTINTRGYTAKNIKLVIWSVNQGKGSGGVNDYVNVCHHVSANHE